MTKSKFIVSMLLMLTMSATTVVAQDVVARIPELQNDESYMSFMRSEANLRQKSDSLVGVVRQIRGEMSRNALQQDSLMQQRADSMMLLLSDAESAIYALQSQKMKLIDQINAIEQQYVLSSLGNIGAAQGEVSSSSIFSNTPLLSTTSTSTLDVKSPS